MANNSQKWAYAEFGRTSRGRGGDYALIKSPSDYAGFGNHYFEMILGEAADKLMLFRRNSQILLGFDGERYFVLRADSDGQDNANRPMAKVRGFFSESGDYTNAFPLEHLDKPINNTGYNEYPQEEKAREAFDDYFQKNPTIREELIKAGHEKKAVVYDTGTGKEDSVLTNFLSEVLPQHMKEGGQLRTPAPRAAETSPSAQEEQRPGFVTNILETKPGDKMGFLKDILEPESKDQALKDELRKQLQDKLKPDANIDKVIADIMATFASSQKGGPATPP